MKYRLTIGFLTVLMLSAGAGNVSAAKKTGPMGFLKAKDQTLKPLLADTKKNKKKILTAIGQMMDFDALSQSSLGAHWDKRTPEEQKEFSTTLRSLIEENLINRLKDSTDHEITYSNETVNADKTEGSVTSMLKNGKDRRAEEIEVVYKMKKKRSKWIVVDMITDGVSMVGNYQSQFTKIINDEGFEGLMKKMKDKLAEEKGEKPAAAASPATP
jgi:phospholipid transport system substrate-binding protein